MPLGIFWQRWCVVDQNLSQIELSGCPQHRTGDFAFIVDGVLGIIEQQMAYINNMLPGSRRSVPYIVDTSEGRQSFFEDMILQMSSHPVLENDRTEQGMGAAILNCARCQAHATFRNSGRTS
jgi:hypothetical protein